jgi:hypothetical protein
VTDHDLCFEVAKKLTLDLGVERSSRDFAWSLASRLAREKLARERRYLPLFLDGSGYP